MSRLTHAVQASIARSRRKRSVLPAWRAYDEAVGWVLANKLRGAGIAVSSLRQVSYPEVTGYLIPTLLDSGERELALDLTRWLISIQRPDGGFSGHSEIDESYVFDTGQVLRGFVAIAHLLPEVEEPLRRAADYLISAGGDGIVRPSAESRWVERYGSHISESIHLYALPPLVEAGRLLGRSDFLASAERSLDYYVRKPNLLEFRFLTHFYGYILEALVDLGRGDLARAGLEPTIAAQWRNGGIPGVPGASWVCSPGALQMAIVGYKLGLHDFADAVLNHMRGLQMPTGSFLGSYGPEAAYAADEELSWACKYFLDACHWRMRSSLAHERDRFRTDVDAQDPRIPAVFAALGDVSGKRVLHAGCGRGQFLGGLAARYPRAELSGLNLTQECLADLPSNVQGKTGAILNLPFKNDTFDVVLCVDAFKDTIRIDRGIIELSRVLRPGGQLIMIDDSIDHLQRMTTDGGEQWFNPQRLAAVLDRHYANVSHSALDSTNPAVSSLRIWRGTRRLESAERSGVPAAGTALQGRRAKQRLARAHRRSQRQAQARVLVGQAFSRYQRQDVRGARGALLRAAILDPRWLGNRGVLSIVAQSLIGPIPTRVRSSARKMRDQFTR